jgi:hypothetical protein
MRRLGFALMITMTISLLTPVPAHAFFWHWLDELSGPGPFNGKEFEFRLYCWHEPDDKADIKREDVARTTTEKAMVLLPVVTSPCLNNVPLNHKRTGSFSLTYTRQGTDSPNLTYDADQFKRRSVKLTTVRPTFWIRPARSVEVGAGVGFYTFSGDDFETFTTWTIEPLIFDVKPFALVRDAFHHGKPPEKGLPDTHFDQILSLRVGLIFFPQEIKDTDFGAKANTFSVSHEKLPSFSVLLDLEPLWRWSRDRWGKSKAAQH